MTHISVLRAAAIRAQRASIFLEAWSEKLEKEVNAQKQAMPSPLTPATHSSRFIRHDPMIEFPLSTITTLIGQMRGHISEIRQFTNKMRP